MNRSLVDRARTKRPQELQLKPVSSVCRFVHKLTSPQINSPRLLTVMAKAVNFTNLRGKKELSIVQGHFASGY